MIVMEGPGDLTRIIEIDFTHRIISCQLINPQLCSDCVVEIGGTEITVETCSCPHHLVTRKCDSWVVVSFNGEDSIDGQFMPENSDNGELWLFPSPFVRVKVLRGDKTVEPRGQSLFDF